MSTDIQLILKTISGVSDSALLVASLYIVLDFLKPLAFISIAAFIFYKFMDKYTIEK